MVGVAVYSAPLVPAGFHRGFDAQPGWVRFLAVFVTSDLFNYLGHRALHEVPALWRLHAVHHSSERMDWLATSRGHPLDEAVNITVAAIPAFALGSATYASVVVAFLYLYPFVAHANARLDVPALGRLVVTPRFHHWHHADADVAVNRNYGAILSIWDDLFGTALRTRGYPERYGIGKPQLAAGDYLGHLISPVSRQLWPGPRGVA